MYCIRYNGQSLYCKISQRIFKPELVTEVMHKFKCDDNFAFGRCWQFGVELKLKRRKIADIIR